MSTEFDIQRARNETRGCERLIHFNNAGAALPPAPVADKVIDYLREEELRGGYELAAASQSALDGFYSSAARLINAQASEIAYMESATRAWQAVFTAIPLKAGDRILTTLSEYGSNVVAYLQRAKQTGCEVVYVPNDEHGQIDTDALAQLIDERVKLISINHIPTGGGLVNPAAEVGRIARAAGVPYLLDACQSVGQLDLDVEQLGCDLLTGTGRKYLRGPRGTGLLYVRSGFLEQLDPSTIDQHAATLLSPTDFEMRPDARRFESWERSCAGQIGLAAAIDYALEWGMPSIQKRIINLAHRFRQQLASLSPVQVTDQGLEQCGIVTFVAKGVSPVDIKHRMAAANINFNVSTGSGSLVSFQARGLDAVVRASVHYYNTEEEIARFIQVLTQILAE